MPKPSPILEHEIPSPEGDRKQRDLADSGASVESTPPKSRRSSSARSRTTGPARRPVRAPPRPTRPRRASRRASRPGADRSAASSDFVKFGATLAGPTGEHRPSSMEAIKPGSHSSGVFAGKGNTGAFSTVGPGALLFVRSALEHPVATGAAAATSNKTSTKQKRGAARAPILEAGGSTPPCVRHAARRRLSKNLTSRVLSRGLAASWPACRGLDSLSRCKLASQRRSSSPLSCSPRRPLRGRRSCGAPSPSSTPRGGRALPPVFARCSCERQDVVDGRSFLVARQASTCRSSRSTSSSKRATRMAPAKSGRAWCAPSSGAGERAPGK